MRNYIALVLLLLVSLGLTAQNDEVKSDKAKIKEEKRKKRKAVKAKKVTDGRSLFTPFAAPAYTPELGGLISAGALWSFKTKRTDTLIQRSSMPFTLAYTTTGAVVINTLLTSYWFEDKMRIYADFWYKDMPDNYWGVGYKAGSETVKSDSTTSFNRVWFWANPRIVFQVKDNYFIGPNIDYNYTQGSDPSAGVASDSIYNHFNDKPLNSGLGLILRYDSRDIPVDARTGLYLDLRGTFYSTGLGGDNNYQIYLLDYRQFLTIKREGMTLGWQAKLRYGVGDVHYGEYSQVGTPFDLRGYQWGRYRDQGLFFIMPEYRHTFLKKNGELGKHSAVIWGGLGTVFNDATFAANDFNWLPNLGIGYRFEIQPRMNVRMDFGFGRETSGFYFNFNQAF